MLRIRVICGQIAAMDWKTRIIEQREISVADLHANPSNWRKHPRAQAEALNAMLDEVGVVQGVIYNRRTERLVDGHLRVELARQRKQPTVAATVVDLSEAEEQLVLATLDPIGAMAGQDDDRLNDLLQSVGSQHGDAIDAVLGDLAGCCARFPAPGDALPRDVRYTPTWAVEVLLDAVMLPRNAAVLDPCAGDGAILRVAAAKGHAVQWVELREEQEQVLRDIGPGQVGDWLEVAPTMSGTGAQGPEVIVTNPPYSIGAEIMAACLATKPTYCAALLRLNHLGSKTWLKLWQAHSPSHMVVLSSKRPSFSDDGKTDASEYFWAVWGCSPVTETSILFK